MELVPYHMANEGSKNIYYGIQPYYLIIPYIVELWVFFNNNFSVHGVTRYQSKKNKNIAENKPKK